jgi:hypothetical protein
MSDDSILDLARRWDVMAQRKLYQQWQRQALVERWLFRLAAALAVAGAVLMLAWGLTA